MNGILNIETISVISSVGVGLLLSTLWQVRRDGHKKFTAEMQRIGWATDSMREHGQALDKFMTLPDVPKSLKAFLLKASDVFETKAFALDMAAKINEAPAGDDAVESDIWLQLQKLSASNTEAYDVFLQALFAGVTAALLRWPETAPVLSRPVTPTQDYIRREVVTTARAVRENMNSAWSGDLLPA
jgi:hypothetical protein